MAALLVLLLMICTVPGHSHILQPKAGVAQRNHQSGPRDVSVLAEERTPEGNTDNKAGQSEGASLVSEDVRGREERIETFSTSISATLSQGEKGEDGRDLVWLPPRTPTLKHSKSHNTRHQEDGKQDKMDVKSSKRDHVEKLRQEERDGQLVAGISLYETRGEETVLGEEIAGKGEDIKYARHNEWIERENEDHMRVPFSRTSSAQVETETKMAATTQIITRSQYPPTLPPPPQNHHHHVPPHVLVTTATQVLPVSQEINTVVQAESPATPKPTAAQSVFKEPSSEEPNPTARSRENKSAAEPVRFTKPVDRPKSNKPVENDTRASPRRPQMPKPSARPRPTAAKTPSARPTKINRGSEKSKEKRGKKASGTQGKEKVTTPTYFPYFTDSYCPPECACYGRVVQCSDKGVDKIPYGIPYNSRYVLLMNNHIDSIQPDLLGQYVSMEFLVLSNNLLTDGAIEGAFEGVPALKRLYLERNLLEGVPTDLPASLEELRLDDNHLTVMSEAAWAQCPGLLVLSLSDNSLGNDSGSLPNAALSPLRRLRTLNLNHNRLTEVPLGLPLSIKELYLKGNHIEQLRGGAFDGTSELLVFDLSANRLTNKGLVRDSLLNATHLESLNLEGNQLKQVPRHLPSSLKTLNLKGNLISSIKKEAFSNMRNLEHLGLARNKISRVALGAFRPLAILHQLDLGHNALLHVPRQLPQGLHSVALAHNKIQSVPRDAFCWGDGGRSPSRLVHVQLQHNSMDMGKLDAQAFRCLRGFQVVHFY